MKARTAHNVFYFVQLLISFHFNIAATTNEGEKKQRELIISFCNRILKTFRPE